MKVCIKRSILFESSMFVCTVPVPDIDECIELALPGLLVPPRCVVESPIDVRSPPITLAGLTPF